ncbi:MAG: hypothetical protein EBY18_24210, partial [Alphaproteobacteria bacterium]|nr:hypothetical protein [Alphaproteobacteria bacterium]
MRVAAGFVIGVAVLVVVAALRLMAGPIDLDFLKSRLAQDFNLPDAKLTVHADRIYAEWSGLNEPIRLVLSGLKISGAAGDAIATAPSVALSFEPRSVVRGKLLPTSIIVAAAAEAGAGNDGDAARVPGESRGGGRRCPRHATLDIAHGHSRALDQHRVELPEQRILVGLGKQLVDQKVDNL